MIISVLGVPGSGKSYGVVNEIYKQFFLLKNPKYLTLFTNISDFDFHLFKSFSFKRDFHYNAYQFDYDKFYISISKLFECYKDKTKSELDLVELAKSLKIYKSMIVIDEAHNYFDKSDDILTFFLTYHRHFYCDIYLITQNISLFYPKYSQLSELFWVGLRRSKALTSSFRYSVYTGLPLSKDTYIESFTLKPDSHIFDFYNSGGKINSKNYGKKYLLLFVLGLFSFFTYMFFVFNKITDSPNSNLNSSSISSEIVSDSSSDSSFDSDCEFIRITCDLHDKYCFSNHSDIYPYRNYSLSHVINSFKDNDYLPIYQQRIDNDNVYFEYCVSNDFLSLYFHRWYNPPIVSSDSNTSFSFFNE